MMVHDNVPFVSVVIPTYNRRELLSGAITSLLNQAYPEDRYEIIVVDNSSTDGTEETVRSLQEKTQKVLQYYRKGNEGPGSARNLGIEKARGDVVAFTDSDCIADVNWLKNGVARMTDGIGLVQGKTLPNPDQTQRTLQQTMKVLSEDSYYQTCNIFYRKEILDIVGGFSPELCGLDFFGRPRWGGEDADLAWRIKKRGWRSVFADDTVVYHHIFPVTTPGEFIRVIHLSIIFTIAHLVRKHPEMRDSLLYRKIFKSKQRALFYILVLSLAAGIYIHWVFLVLGIPYVIKLISASFSRRPLRSYHRGLALFCIILFVELVESVLSICASLVYRTVIL